MVHPDPVGLIPWAYQVKFNDKTIPENRYQCMSDMIYTTVLHRSGLVIIFTMFIVCSHGECSSCACAVIDHDYHNTLEPYKVMLITRKPIAENKENKGM